MAQGDPYPPEPTSSPKNEFETMKLFALLALLTFGLTACSSTTESTEPMDVQAAIVNDLCPLAGTAVDEEKVVEYDGKMVAFCCDNCLSNWGGMTDEARNEALAKVMK